MPGSTAGEEERVGLGGIRGGGSFAPGTSIACVGGKGDVDLGPARYGSSAAAGDRASMSLLLALGGDSSGAGVGEGLRLMGE